MAKRSYVPQIIVAFLLAVQRCVVPEGYIPLYLNHIDFELVTNRLDFSPWYYNMVRFPVPPLCNIL